MNLKQSLIECIPPAYYSNGEEATCLTFRIFNMFDVDSQIFKQVKEKKGMEDVKVTKGDTNVELISIPTND